MFRDYSNILYKVTHFQSLKINWTNIIWNTGTVLILQATDCQKSMDVIKFCISSFKGLSQASAAATFTCCLSVGVLYLIKECSVWFRLGDWLDQWRINPFVCLEKFLGCIFSINLWSTARSILQHLSESFFLSFCSTFFFPSLWHKWI